MLNSLNILILKRVLKANILALCNLKYLYLISKFLTRKSKYLYILVQIYFYFPSVAISKSRSEPAFQQ